MGTMTSGDKRKRGMDSDEEQDRASDEMAHLRKQNKLLSEENSRLLREQNDYLKKENERLHAENQQLRAQHPNGGPQQHLAQASGSAPSPPTKTKSLIKEMGDLGSVPTFELKPRVS